MTRELLIVQPGQKLPSLADYPGDFGDWVLGGMGLGRERARIVRPHVGESLPELAGLEAVVVTGSGAMVTDREPWVEESACWLRSALEAGLAVLGICFGHQLLAHALGGEVQYNPRGVEVGTVALSLHPAAAADPLFAHLPQTLAAHVSHQQSVVRLPPGGRLLASSELDPHQAVAIGERAWGVQFHPEFRAAVVGRYLDHHAPAVAARGGDPQRLRAAIRDLPWGPTILARFARLAGLAPGTMPG
jgi:GMP synthase (glutamine-hydrolysing)